MLTEWRDPQNFTSWTSHGPLGAIHQRFRNAMLRGGICAASRASGRQHKQTSSIDEQAPTSAEPCRKQCREPRRIQAPAPAPNIRVHISGYKEYFVRQDSHGLRPDRPRLGCRRTPFDNLGSLSAAAPAGGRCGIAAVGAVWHGGVGQAPRTLASAPTHAWRNARLPLSPQLCAHLPTRRSDK